MLATTRGVILGYGYSVEARAFFNRTSGMMTTRARLIDKLIKRFIACDAWRRFDALWLPAVPDSTTAALNLKSSSFTLAASGTAPTFTADRGFSYANTTGTKYIDSNFNFSTGTNFLQNSAHISFWNPISSTATDIQQLAGTTGTVAISVQQLFTKFSDNSCYLRVNDGIATVAPGFANTNRQGFFVANRSSSTARQGYINGASVLSGSYTSAVPQNDKLAFLGAGPAVSGNTNINDTFAFGSIGGDISDIQLRVYLALREYMTSVGIS